MQNKLKGSYQKISSDYSIYYDEYLGKGAYGEVYKGFSKSKGCIVAIKKLIGYVERIWKKHPNLKRQIEVMQKLKHENILRLFDLLETEGGIYIITQYCDGGDLQKEIKEKKFLSEIQCYQYFRKIVAGMTEVNNQKYLHRDLKPENIMLMQDGTPKIGDFGQARQIIGNDIVKLRSYERSYERIGTPMYTAPNVIKGDDFSGLCDVWSLGLILYEMLTGKNLFAGVKNVFALQKQHDKLQDNPFQLEGDYCRFFKIILSKMIAYEENQRWTFAQINEYLKKNKSAIQNQLGMQSQIVLVGKQSTIQQKDKMVEEKPKAQQKPKIKIPTVYQQKPKPTVNNSSASTQQSIINPTQALMKQAESNQQNYHNALVLFKFATHLCSRGQLLTEAVKKLNTQSNYPLQNLHKYTVMYLQLGIFMNTLEQLSIFIKAPIIQLPNGIVIKKDGLDKKSKDSLETYINEYLEKLKAQKSKYTVTMEAVCSKMFSKPYKEKYSNVYSTYSDLYSSIEKARTTKSLLPIQFFEKKECQLKIHNPPQKIIRLYHMILYLAFLKEKIPNDTFQKTDQINKIKQYFQKEPIQNINNSIAELKVKLMIKPSQVYMKQTELKQQNLHNILVVFKFATHLCSRVCLFTEAVKKLNIQSNYPLQNLHKLTLIYLQLGIFMNTLEELSIFIKAPIIQLPNGIVIKKDNLDERSKEKFQNYNNEYLEKLEAEKSQYTATMVVYSKMFQKSQKEKYSKVYSTYSDLYSSIKKAHSQKTLLPIQFFEKYYKQFLRKECQLKIHNPPQKIIRLYHMILYLAFLKEKIPNDTFQKTDQINKIKQYFQKEPIQNINNSIAELEVKLIGQSSILQS